MSSTGRTNRLVCSLRNKIFLFSLYLLLVLSFTLSFTFTRCRGKGGEGNAGPYLEKEEVPGTIEEREISEEKGIPIDKDALEEGKKLLSKENKIRKEILGESLFGMYFGSKYTGFMSTKISEGTYEGKKVYKIVKEAKMEAGPMTASMKTVAYTLPNFSPLYSEFSSEEVTLEKSEKKMKKLWRKDEKIIIEEEINGEKKKYELSFEKDIVWDPAVEDIIYLLLDLNTPKKYGFNVLYPEEKETGIDYLEVKGKEEITIKGKSLIAYKIIKISSGGESIPFWVNENKQIVKIDLEPITVIAITKEEIGKNLISEEKKVSLEQRSPCQVVADFFSALKNKDKKLLESCIAFEPMCEEFAKGQEEELSADGKKSMCEFLKTMFLNKMLSGEMEKEVPEFGFIDFINEEMLEEEIIGDKAKVSFKEDEESKDKGQLFELVRENGAWKIILK